MWSMAEVPGQLDGHSHNHHIQEATLQHSMEHGHWTVLDGHNHHTRQHYSIPLSMLQMLDELLHSALHCTDTLYNTYRAYSAYIRILGVHNNHTLFHYAAASQALSNIEVEGSWVEVGHNCGFVLHLTSTFNQSSIIHSSLLHCSLVGFGYCRQE